MKTAKKVLSVILAVMLVVGTLSVAASAYVNPPDDTMVSFSLLAEVYDSYGEAARELKDSGVEFVYDADAPTDEQYNDTLSYEDWDHDVFYTCEDEIEVNPSKNYLPL